MNNYQVALYIRLSKEDEHKTSINSESVENQVNLLNEYVLKNNYQVYDTYIDDGYTGTNFNRPSFNRLIKDIESKKVNMIIVKDLSRFGRDYILTGYYLEMFFPSKNVRFISILDNYDSINNLNEYMPFKSIINDMYSKDNSKKVKAALRIKQQMGKWVGGCTPFGYTKEVNDKNKLVVEPREAAVVKKIFSLFLKGYSLNKIADYLYTNGIHTPTQTRNINKETKYSKLGYWSTTTIKSILTNELYTGDLVQNRRSKINYKIRKIKRNDRSEWITIKNTHEKIINKKDFINVKRLLDAKTTIRKNNKNECLLSGLLKCFECKKRIAFQKNNNSIYIVCNTYKKYSKLGLCTSHSNNYKRLESMIIEKIDNILSQLQFDIKIDRELILLLINKIEIHKDKNIDIYFNFKKPSFIA